MRRQANTINRNLGRNLWRITHLPGKNRILQKNSLILQNMI